jgi:hypothetical protein
MKIRHVWGKVYGSSLEENYTSSCGKHICKIVWFLEIIIQLFGKNKDGTWVHACWRIACKEFRLIFNGSTRSWAKRS